MENIKGKIVQVVGPVVDVQFNDGELPKLNEAIKIDNHGEELIIEVSEHIGDNTVRCIAMDTTDGLIRGMEATATGNPIMVPVGEKTLGRMVNVLGQPIDGKEMDMDGVKLSPIHRDPPSFEQQQPVPEVFETGIKVVDLICPYTKGGKIGYDVIVDAISKLNVEDESDLFVVVPNAWKADLRKDPDYKAARMGEVVYSGQVGTICGIPVIFTNALKTEAFVMNKEAIKLFMKKDIEVEQDRDIETKTNTVSLTTYYICALVDNTKICKIVEASA